jgi:hypothetical protein
VPRTGDRDPPVGKVEAGHDAGEWLTEEGDVVIDAEGRSVFITESVDEPTSQKLENQVFNRSQSPPR